MLIAGGAAYYLLFYKPAHKSLGEPAYVLPESVELVDTPAEVRIVVGTVRRGERLEVIQRTRNWAEIRTAQRVRGWIELKNLLDSATYQAGERLLDSLADLSPQAEGHTNGVVNLRLEPARDAAQLTQLPANDKLQVFARRLVERPTTNDEPAKIRDAWYLIRAESHAGWILGKFVALDVPEALARYAQGTNMVAWTVIKTVNDDGKQVPEYLVADRMGSQDVDFTHIRVFTWWPKHQEYVTAYVESSLNGYFPIRVTPQGGTPYFRLRLKDDDGQEFQKVYGLFDTLTRVVGTVPGWESDAMPPPPEPRHPASLRRRRR